MDDIRLLTALADPTRRLLLERLTRGPCSVGELVALAPVSQPAVSQHLRVLRGAHLVRVQKHGSRRIYRVDPTALRSLRQWVESLERNVADSEAGP